MTDAISPKVSPMTAADAVETATDAGSVPKRPPTASELAWQSVAMCLRVSVLVAFLGMVMWWGFRHDQQGFPGSLLNPDDVAYLEGDQARVFQQGELDEIFTYPEMVDLYRDNIVMNDHRAQIGSFKTYDSFKRVMRYYRGKWRARDLVVMEETEEEDEWMLVGRDEREPLQYDVRVVSQGRGMTQVFFSKNQVADDFQGAQGQRGRRATRDELPPPRGRYEHFQIAASPGTTWGKTQQYVTDSSVDGIFSYYREQLLRLGWREAEMGLPTMNAKDFRTALFRRGAHSCMLNAGPHNSSRDWRSIVSLTFF